MPRDMHEINSDAEHSELFDIKGETPAQKVTEILKNIAHAFHLRVPGIDSELPTIQDSSRTLPSLQDEGTLPEIQQQQSDTPTEK